MKLSVSLCHHYKAKPDNNLVIKTLYRWLANSRFSSWYLKNWKWRVTRLESGQVHLKFGKVRVIFPIENSLYNFPEFRGKNSQLKVTKLKIYKRNSKFFKTSLIEFLNNWSCHIRLWCVHSVAVMQFFLIFNKILLKFPIAWIWANFCSQNTGEKMQSDQAVGWPTSSSHLDIPKNDNGKCQKCKMDYSFILRS